MQPPNNAARNTRVWLARLATTLALFTCIASSPVEDVATSTMHVIDGPAVTLTSTAPTQSFDVTITSRHTQHPYASTHSNATFRMLDLIFQPALVQQTPMPATPSDVRISLFDGMTLLSQQDISVPSTGIESELGQFCTEDNGTDPQGCAVTIVLEWLAGPDVAGELDIELSCLHINTPCAFVADIALIP